MPLSIRSRMILAMNLLVAAVGSVVGYAGIEVATSQIAQRLVQESARKAGKRDNLELFTNPTISIPASFGRVVEGEDALDPRNGRPTQWVKHTDVCSSLPLTGCASLKLCPRSFCGTYDHCPEHAFEVIFRFL